MVHYESTKEDLEQLKAFSNSLNKYARLEPGESKEWYFNPKTVRPIENKFDKNKPRVEFDVYDPVLNHETTWQTSKAVGQKIMSLMQEGKNFLKITRFGEKLDTRYSVEEVKP